MRHEPIISHGARPGSPGSGDARAAARAQAGAMPHRVAAALLASLVVLAGCGSESASDKAQSQVCDARANIQKSIESLQDLTVSTATVDGIRQQLQGIRKDLSTIRNAQGDLNAERQDQLKSANSEFAATIKDVASTVLRSTSAQDAQAQVQKAADQLEATYKSTLSPIDCS
jgi:ribosome-associated translation inhibitor RaiA